MTQIHQFEAAGLGKAPFRYVGMVAQDIQHGERVLGSVGGVAMTTKPGGTCAFCGAYIVAMFNVESADGQRFHVGCDCIKKVGDAGLLQQIARDVRQHKIAKTHARQDKQIAEGKAWIEEHRDELRLTAHPDARLKRYFADKSMLDYLEWMLKNAGRAGALRAIRRAKGG